MIKIISGERRGASLKTLEGMDTRPLRGRIRESLFSIVRPKITNAIVWDLFAGSGGVGLEALSNGAQASVFIEPNREALNIVRDNVRKLRYEEKSNVIDGKMPKDLHSIPSKYHKPDLVFLMPPYHSGLAGQVFQSIEKNDFGIKPDTWFIVETHRKEDDITSQRWERFDVRDYGITRLSFYKFLG